MYIYVVFHVLFTLKFPVEACNITIFCTIYCTLNRAITQGDIAR